MESKYFIIGKSASAWSHHEFIKVPFPGITRVLSVPILRNQERCSRVWDVEVGKQNVTITGIFSLWKKK